MQKVQKDYTTKEELNSTYDEFLAEYDKLDEDYRLLGAGFDAYHIVNEAMNDRRAKRISNSRAAQRIQSQLERIRGEW